MWPLLSALSTVLAALLAVWSWLWWTRVRTAVPGPPTLPLLGNLLYFRTMPILVPHLRNIFQEYGEISRFYIGPKLFLGVGRAEDVQKVMAASKRRDSFTVRAFRIILGDGLLTSEGAKWKAHRKLIEPGFGREVYSSYFMNVFNTGATAVCEQMAKRVGVEQDIYTFIFLETINSIMRASFGVSLEDLISDANERQFLADEMANGLKFLQKRVIRPWHYLDGLLFLSESGRRLKKSAALIRNVMCLAVHRLSEESINKDPNIKYAMKDMVAAKCTGKNISKSDVEEEAVTIVMAGSETSASTISYALSVLGLHPEWQEKAVKELQEVYGTGEDYLRPSTTEDLSRLVVLESIIKETIRLFPIVVSVPHEVGEDVPLAGGRYVAPRGASVFVAYYALHRQPDVFPDPEKFDPGRFMEGGSAVHRKPYSYLPFGTGPRMCIGGRYAMTFIKTVLSAVLRRFHMLPGSTRQELEEIVFSLTGHPLTGYKVAWEPRKDRISP